MKKTLGRFFTNSLLTIFSLLVCLTIFEIILRFLPHTEFRYERYLYRIHPKLGFVLNPNFTGKTVMHEFMYHSKINRHGLREDIEYDYNKPQGIYRMIFLGDSFVYGCVEKKNSFEDIFERSIKEKGNNKIEVINLSAPGYGTYHELILLDEFGLRYDPDKAVLFFFWNDIEDNILEKNLATVISGYRIRTAGKSPTLLFQTKTILKANLLAYRFFSERTKQFFNKLKPKNINNPSQV